MGPGDQLEEALSALCDGELDGETRNELLQRLCSDPELKQRWESYHLIRDALSNNLPSDFSVELSQQVMQFLDDEPAHSAPALDPSDSDSLNESSVIHASDRFAQTTTTVNSVTSKRQVILRRLAGFAIAASVASVALISYQVGLQQRGPELAKQEFVGSPTQMATINGVTVMASPAPVVQRSMPAGGAPVIAAQARGQERGFGEGANSLPNVTSSQTLPPRVMNQTELQKYRKLNQYLMDHNQAYSNSRMQGVFPYARIMMVPGRTTTPPASQASQPSQSSQLSQQGR